MKGSVGLRAKKADAKLSNISGGFKLSKHLDERLCAVYHMKHFKNPSLLKRSVGTVYNKLSMKRTDVMSSRKTFSVLTRPLARLHVQNLDELVLLCLAARSVAVREDVLRVILPELGRDGSPALDAQLPVGAEVLLHQRHQQPDDGGVETPVFVDQLLVHHVVRVNLEKHNMH